MAYHPNDRKLSQLRTERGWFQLLIHVSTLSLPALLVGCQMLGPVALGVGRGAYNDVIARSGAEQTLGLIVRLRYADPIGLLTVSSVTAGLKFSAQAQSQAGFGSPQSYAGNLVPFSAGVGYEDSPTITYTPVDGNAFFREWLAPTTTETLALVLQSAPQGALIALLVERMNGLRSGGRVTVEERTAFYRAATLLAELRELGIASWAQQSDKAGTYELMLSDYSPSHVSEVQELLRLLDLRGDPVRESVIRIPMVMGVRDGKFEGLAVQTRSVAEIMRHASAGIEVPRDHIEEGLVDPSGGSAGALAVPGPTLRIHSSRSSPKGANVAVQHRGWWYYVNDADLASKRTFLQIQMIFLTRLSEAMRGNQATPLLTIPVR